MEADAGRRSTRQLIVYALANAGGVVAFLPLLTLLLPLKLEAVAGDARLGALTIATLAGAVSASVSNIVFGRLSDRSVARGKTRRCWAMAGLALTILGYAALHIARTPATIVAAVVAWQFALNALLAPLFAMIADEVPDGQKGVAGGLLTLANPVASLVSALLVATAMLGEAGRFALVCIIVTAMVAPVLSLRAQVIAPPATFSAPRTIAPADMWLAWASRLMVQIAGNVLFTYLLFYFHSLVPDQASDVLAPRVGQVMAIAFAIPLPFAVLAGRLSDRTGARKPFLMATAALAAIGLAVMATASDWNIAVGGFALYACGSAMFLALHSAYAMHLLVRPERHGWNLGLINLANTLPALVGPSLTWLFATADDFAPLLSMLAVLTFAGGLLALPIRGHRRPAPVAP